MENLLKELIKNVQIFQKNKDKKDYVYSYNVFSVLNIENREIYHSRFLADLLNPNGLHNQRNLFLKNLNHKIQSKSSKFA